MFAKLNHVAMFGAAAERPRRLELVRENCPLYRYHMTDADGILLSVAEVEAEAEGGVR